MSSCQRQYVVCLGKPYCHEYQEKGNKKHTCSICAMFLHVSWNIFLMSLETVDANSG